MKTVIAQRDSLVSLQLNCFELEGEAALEASRFPDEQGEQTL